MAGRFTRRKHNVKFCRASVLSSPSEEQQRQADKINRKFSARLRRLEHWHNLSAFLSDIEEMPSAFNGASPDDVKAMKEIHRLVKECRAVAGDRLKEAQINGKILR